MHASSHPFGLRVFLLSIFLLATSLSLNSAPGATPRVPQNTSAQQSTVQGTVRDTSDASVAGATVILTLSPTAPGSPAAQTSNQTNTQTSTLIDGRFTLQIPPGQYRLEIAHSGFLASDQTVVVAAGETRDITVRLALAPLSASVIVSAEALPEAAAEASEPVDIITRDQIDQRQDINLVPLLETLPGMSLGQGGQPGGPASIYLDGGRYNFTKVLIDGVPMNDPGGEVDFSNITLDNIDKVEVVHGAQSALSGSDAVDGSLELFSHQGSTQTPLAVFEGQGGSFGTGRGSAQLSGMIQNFDYSVDSGYFQTAGEGPYDSFIERTNSGNFGYRFSKTDTVRVTVRYISSNAGIPGQELYEPPLPGQNNILQNLSAGLTWNFSTGAHWQHRIFASETDIHETYQFLPYPNYVNEYNRVDAQAQSSYVTSHFGITLGYWYEVENGVPGDLTFNVNRNNMAGFLDGHWQVTSRLTVNAGFREDDNANFGLHADPRAGASYALRSGSGQGFWGPTRLRFIYGQGIKEPQFDQSYGASPCAPGNPDLAPEQSNTYNAGIEQTLAGNKVVVSGDFFYNRFRDIISFADLGPTTDCPISIGGYGTFFNTDLARARGSHIRFQTQITRRMTVSGNYTYDDSRVLAAPNAFDPSETPGNRIFYVPVNAGNLVWNGTFGRFQANLIGVFVGRRTDSDFFGLGYTSVPGYVRVDMALSYRLSPRVALIGTAQNLFNAKYQNELGYPALGIGAYAGIRVSLGGDASAFKMK